MDEQKRLSDAYSSLKVMYDNLKAAIILRDQKISKLEFRMGELLSEIAELKDTTLITRLTNQLTAAKAQIAAHNINNKPTYKKLSQRLSSDIICISVYAVDKGIEIPGAYMKNARKVIEFLKGDQDNDTGTDQR